MGTVKFNTSAIAGAFHEFALFTGLSSIGSMGGSTFTGITVPEGITSVGAAAFQQCSKLVVVNLPSTITSLGSMAFYRCPSMSLTILATTPPTRASGSFTLPGEGTIYVPAGSVDAYKEAWSGYASRIQTIP